MKPVVSDTALRDAVINELEHDPDVVSKHISVNAVNGAVTLGGHVAAIHQKHAAVRAAERVNAVRAVADDIDVNEPAVNERADDEIAEEIAQLRHDDSRIPDAVRVQVRDGRVILSGEVDSPAERDAAVSAVRPLPGVRAADDLLKIRSQQLPAAVDIEDRVHQALAHVVDSASRSIRVTITDGTAHLAGHVPSEVALQAAMNAARMTPGITAVESTIAITGLGSDA